MVLKSEFTNQELNEALKGVQFKFDPAKFIGHEDDRRKIKEDNRENDSWQHFKIKNGGKPLANHYHKTNHEEFFFQEGTGLVHTAPVGEDGKICGEITTFEVRPGTKLTIPPRTAHRFDVGKGAKFICHSSQRFDPENKDLHSSPIVLLGE